MKNARNKFIHSKKGIWLSIAINLLLVIGFIPILILNIDHHQTIKTYCTAFVIVVGAFVLGMDYIKMKKLKTTS